MVSRPGSARRLLIAAVILSFVYLSLSTYMRCYFAYSRLDGWNGGRVQVRYFATNGQQIVFWPALVVESLLVGQPIGSELEK